MAEMYCSSHRSKPVSERNPQGVKGSIVQVDGRGNYKGVGMRGANELYGDSEAFSLACTPNRDSSARYELEAQLYVLQQKLDTERVLWQVNGNGGTGSGKGVPMYTACIVSMVVHRNDEEGIVESTQSGGVKHVAFPFVYLSRNLGLGLVASACLNITMQNSLVINNMGEHIVN